MNYKTVSAWEARRNFGKLMDEVSVQDRPVIVESHGNAKVGIVPIRVVERYERERAEFFAAMRANAERVNMPEDEVERLVSEEIEAYRRERRESRLAQS